MRTRTLLVTLFSLALLGVPQEGAAKGYPKAKKACKRLKHLYIKARNAHRAFRSRWRVKIGVYLRLRDLIRRRQGNTKLKKKRANTLRFMLRNKYKPTYRLIQQFGRKLKSTLKRARSARPGTRAGKKLRGNSGKKFLRFCGFHPPKYLPKKIRHTKGKPRHFLKRKPVIRQIPRKAFKVSLDAFEAGR